MPKNMRQSIRTEVDKCKTQNLTLKIFLPLSLSASPSVSCLMISVIFLTNILCRPSNEDEEYRRMRDRYEEE